MKKVLFGLFLLFISWGIPIFLGTLVQYNVEELWLGSVVTLLSHRFFDSILGYILKKK